MFFDTLLGIMGIKDGNYRPENDLSGEEYNHSINDLATLHGAKKILEEKDDSILNYRKKIWLHRVNSPGKMEEFKYNYEGFEMDIIYHAKENAFENSHDETDLKKYLLNNTLKYYKRENLWFDFKNLTQENKIQAKDHLEALLREYKIPKSKVWLESPNWEALEIFTHDGWNTSYYMPYYNFDKMSADEVEKIRSEVEAISYSGKVRAISFAGRYYSFITSLKLNPEISLLTWIDGHTLKDLKNMDYVLRILQNPQVKVVLVEEYGEYHR